MKKVKTTIILSGMLLPIALFSNDCKNTIDYEIITGSKTGTYYQIGKNLAKYVAPNACINLKY